MTVNRLDWFCCQKTGYKLKWINDVGPYTLKERSDEYQRPTSPTDLMDYKELVLLFGVVHCNALSDLYVDSDSLPQMPDYQPLGQDVLNPHSHWKDLWNVSHADTIQYMERSLAQIRDGAPVHH